MTASQIAKFLLVACPSLSYFESFMFGSTLSGIGQDVDLLIVGARGENLLRLKNELSLAGARLPLHILFMQPDEVHETDFVVRQKCVSLLRLSRAANEQI
ncbi:hypothetical protein [Falsiroseomonas sp.]|uniref:hypothetical protein n=1 Tax=Falsiroseomonas sp. TaxID=2870721 RepID=UPI003F71EB07